MRVLALVVALGGSALLLQAGCGQRAPDLFVLQRAGSIPGARLTLNVSDEGTVRCNQGARRRLDDDQVLAARRIARELKDPALRGVTLAPGPNSVLAYRLRLADGMVSFSDTSPGLSPQLARVEGFARSVAQQVCGLAR